MSVETVSIEVMMVRDTHDMSIDWNAYDRTDDKLAYKMDVDFLKPLSLQYPFNGLIITTMDAIFAEVERTIQERL